MNMKAIRLMGKDDLQVVSVPVPEFADDEVLVKTGGAYICGTDVRMFKNGTKVMPLTLGHEFAGTIAAVGKSVKGYKAGMRVAVAPNYGCGICDQCVSGNTHLCDTILAIGVQMDGGFAEYVKIPAPAVVQGNLSLIPDQLSLADAAMAEPLSCVYNSFERAALHPGDTVLIIGAGPIGLLHAKVYLMAGAGMVIMNDMNEERLAVCKKDEPAIVTLGPDGLREKLLALTNGRGADVVVTAASVPVVQQTAFDLAALNGRVIFFGGLPAGKEIVPLDTNIIHYKMITVTGTSRQSLRQYRTCLDLIAKGLIRVGGVVTASLSLDEAAQAFDLSVRGIGLKTGFHIG